MVGPDGEPGPNGIAGSIGEKGDPGLTGERGIDGLDGPPGIFINIFCFHFLFCCIKVCCIGMCTTFERMNYFKGGFFFA